MISLFPKGFISPKLCIPEVSWKYNPQNFFQIYSITAQILFYSAGVSVFFYSCSIYFTVSDHFGFGMMNAELMVSRSLTWKNVPEQRVCKSENIRVNGYEFIHVFHLFRSLKLNNFKGIFLQYVILV